MHTALLPAAPRPAPDLFRPHRGRGLVAADLGRARSAASAPPCAPAATGCAPPCCPGCPPTCAACASSTPAAAPARSRSRRRGAARDVVAIDLSPTLVGARARAQPQAISGAGAIDFRVGDMLDPALGRFDHVVAMDSLIHYAAGDAVRAVTGLAARADRLGALHLRAAHPAAGGDARGRPALPAQRPRAGDRAGAGRRRCSARLAAAAGLAAWRIGRDERVAVRLLHLPGAWSCAGHEPRERHAGARRGAGSARGSCRSPTRRRRSCRSAGCCACRCSRCRSAWRWCCSTARSNRVMIVELGVPGLAGRAAWSRCRCCSRRCAR